MRTIRSVSHKSYMPAIDEHGVVHLIEATLVEIDLSDMCVIHAALVNLEELTMCDMLIAEVEPVADVGDTELEICQECVLVVNDAAR